MDVICTYICVLLPLPAAMGQGDPDWDHGIRKEKSLTLCNQHFHASLGPSLQKLWGGGGGEVKADKPESITCLQQCDSVVMILMNYLSPDIVQVPGDPVQIALLFTSAST